MSAIIDQGLMAIWIALCLKTIRVQVSSSLAETVWGAIGGNHESVI